MYVCMYVCMHVCIYVCMYVCMHACMHACMHVCMYVCMYLCMYVCVYITRHLSSKIGCTQIGRFGARRRRCISPFLAKAEGRGNWSVENHLERHHNIFQIMCNVCDDIRMLVHQCRPQMCVCVCVCVFVCVCVCACVCVCVRAHEREREYVSICLYSSM